MMNGIEHIAAAFRDRRAAQRAALMPYLTLGYPTAEISLRAVIAVAQKGADLLELGIPFSDPLADGPTIQHSTQVALEQGLNVHRCLELTAQIRASGVEQPLLLMGYVNPILAYGIENYVRDAALAGADGLIVPDLPLEEAHELEAACQRHNLALVFLLSPASPLERLERLARQTSGFLYLVSLTGVTGARDTISDELPAFILRARAAAHTPLAVGFGISTPQQAAEVGALCDGVIIGSALINTMRSALENGLDPASAAGDFVKSLRHELDNSTKTTH
jgi:tryptophan synthase alpha chain